jgi:hypothetical protein
LAIAFSIIEGFFFFVCALPYLIPLGDTQAEISPDRLVSEPGRFLDIGGRSIHLEEQSSELFNTMVLNFLQSYGD